MDRALEFASDAGDWKEIMEKLFDDGSRHHRRRILRFSHFDSKVNPRPSPAELLWAQL